MIIVKTEALDTLFELSKDAKYILKYENSSDEAFKWTAEMRKKLLIERLANLEVVDFYLGLEEEY